MKLLRTEHYTDSEGDPAQRKYYIDDNGQHIVCGPGYLLPCDADGAVAIPAGDTPMRFVNFTMTYEAKAKGEA
jgi:hypothetical protein